MVGKADINDKLVRFAWWALATIAFALIIAIRIRLLGIPLERDEGEPGARAGAQGRQEQAAEARLSAEKRELAACY